MVVAISMRNLFDRAYHRNKADVEMDCLLKERTRDMKERYSQIKC